MRKRKEQVPSESSPTPKMLTVMQVAEAMGVGKDTVYGLIKHEGLPAISVGVTGTRQKLRVSVTSLDQWIKQREQLSTLAIETPTDIQTDGGKPDGMRRANKRLAS